MDIGLLIEGQEGVEWSQWLALAKACDEGGIHALLTSDHFGSLYGANRCSLDAWAVVNALSAVTERVRLGVLVSPPTFRHPSDLSRLAATADHISGGRVEAGLGVGWNEEEHRAYGFRFPEAPARMKMLSEGAEIIYRQWTEDVFDYSGTYFVLERCSALPKPVSRVGYPPLIIGGSARQKTAGLAARFAAEYNTTFGATPDACRERRQHLDEACVAVNRDPSTLRFSAMTEFVIGRDSDAVQYRLERIASLQGLDGGQAFLDSDGMHGRSMLVGTPAAILARLEEYRAVGVDRVILQHLLHDDLEALELLAQEILPSIGR